MKKSQNQTEENKEEMVAIVAPINIKKGKIAEEKKLEASNTKNPNSQTENKAKKTTTPKKSGQNQTITSNTSNSKVQKDITTFMKSFKKE